MTEAATIVAQQPRRVFLTIGRQGVDAFAENASSWFLIRSIDAPDTSMPPHHEVLLARGPFDSAGEIELMRSRGIELVVSKNSGGAMTEAKLVAARELRIPIVMIDRPRTPPGDFETGAVDDVVSWLRRRL
ncbi:precorrin-6A/cobalt-precorrin-6A reductase [Rhodococcoides kyotonense]|uniref:Precorrin-6A/cobalt-precorrin-6A reductase n=2 Tax=Rhodococcoides kyotonense TaxID=398843 RepID=A0A239CJS7_9NOCA|nr:precorrin-6A/cobalt-precorrin-6A reductase [Rhodococcus kyotonensis]